MPLSRTRYVQTLLNEEGYREGRDPDGNWNNHQKFSPAVAGLEWSQDQAWCHSFVSWGAYVNGQVRDVIPITASCSAGVAWFQARSRWTEYPVLGGPFYMGASGGDHVGVVHAYDGDWIYTIEGNTNVSGSYQGNGVYRRKRPRRGAGSPYGYGVPAFTEKTVSADPRWGGIRSASYDDYIQEEEDMALTNDDVNKILGAQISIPDGRKVSLAEILAWTDNRHNVTFAKLVELQKAVADLAAIVRAKQ